MFIASRNISSIDKLKVQLSSEFEMKDLREVKRTRGMKIESDRGEGESELNSESLLVEGALEVSDW